MNRFLGSLVLLTSFVISSIAEPPFETSVIVTKLKVRYAESASIESMSGKVAIFSVNSDQVEQDCINLQITTQASGMLLEARQVLGQCVGPAIQPTKRQNGDWFFSGTPGKYEVGISLFGDGAPQKITLPDVVMGDPKPVDPDKPVDPPPVTGDLESFYKASYDASKAMSDPNTSKALAVAYAAALEATKGKDMTETKAAINEATAKTMRERSKPSFKLAWDVFIVQTNERLKSLSGDVASYRAAISVLIKALNAS